MKQHLPYSLPKFEQFLLFLQSNNYSQETVYNYEKDLRSFEIFIVKELHVPFPNLKKEHLEEFKAYLNSRDRVTPGGSKSKQFLKSSSINRCLSSLRRYLRYLIDLDEQVPIPPDSIKLLRKEKRHARVADFSDLVRLIESPTRFEKNTLVAHRNRAMLEVLFSTGMRISELLSLKRDQIDNSGRIFIRGKGKKERFVYLTARSMGHLRDYLSTRLDISPYVFIPYRGRNNQKSEKRISCNYLQYKIKRYKELLGINVPTSAHSLRHGFATYLAENGANPAAIQILLGHESLETTTRYVHASDTYARKTHAKFHPLKK